MRADVGPFWSRLRGDTAEAPRWMALFSREGERGSDLRNVSSKSVQCVEKWMSVPMCQVPKEVRVLRTRLQKPRGLWDPDWDHESATILRTLNAASPIRSLSWMLYYICGRKLVCETWEAIMGFEDEKRLFSDEAGNITSNHCYHVGE